MAVSKKKQVDNSITPLMAAYGGKESLAVQATRTRRNKSGSIERTDRFQNINDGLVPFKYTTSGSYNTSNLDVRDAVVLCQKAYYNFSIFRNTIDLMTEFSVSALYFTGGSKKSKGFFDAFFKKINISSLLDRFFREYYRSGNVFIYRFDAVITPADIVKISQTFGADDYLKESDKIMIPSRYCILNPADIQLGGNISFVSGKYYKLLTDYELERLRDPRTEEDLEVLDNLPSEIRKKIKEPKNSSIVLPLNSDKITAVFYKKQDYEPFAVPMGYPVLEDINWKQEMKKMDMAITRTTQQVVLLVTMGTDPDRGGVNQKNLEAMRTLFENQSVGRVLIADYTTKAEFVVPNIASILDPKKYEVVNRDIQLGLNNILISGDEKFANAQIKTQVFVERLKQGRDIFISDFLLPEIKRISKSLGFRNFPIPHFTEIELKDDNTYSRVYTRLIELGILTPEEGIEAINTGRLPTNEESLESQEDYKKLRNKGFYEPIMGGPSTQKQMAKEKEKNQPVVSPVNPNESQTGRPSGTKGIPQETKKVTPIGGSTQFSLTKIKDSLIQAQELVPEIECFLRKMHKKRKLSKQQKEVASEIASIIIANENPKDWSSKVNEYCSNPVDTDKERIDEIREIAFEHQIDDYLASILYNSKA
jgi:hypothetical protein